MKRVATIGLGVLLLTGPVLVSGGVQAADVIYSRQTGEPTAQGTVTEFSKTELKVQPPNQSQPVVTVEANEVGRVRWDGEPPELNLRRTDERGGRLERALEGYRTALANVESGQSHLRSDLEFLIARATARAALADVSKLEEAVEKLDGFLQSHPNHFRYYSALQWLGRVHLANGDFSRAQEAFDRLKEAPWPDVQMAAEIARGRLLLEQGKVAEAAAAFDRVIEQPAESAAEKSRRYEALLGKAGCLVEQDRYEQALKTLDGVIDEVPVSETSVMAEAYLRQGAALRAMGRPKDAVLAYLHLDVLPAFAREKDLHAEALFHLANLWGTVGRPGRADEAAARLRQEYPNSEWTEKLGGGTGGS